MIPRENIRQNLERHLSRFVPTALFLWGWNTRSTLPTGVMAVCTEATNDHDKQDIVFLREVVRVNDQ